jgi:hypothetical protein
MACGGAPQVEPRNILGEASQDPVAAQLKWGRKRVQVTSTLAEKKLVQSSELVVRGQQTFLGGWAATASRENVNLTLLVLGSERRVRAFLRVSWSEADEVAALKVGSTLTVTCDIAGFTESKKGLLLDLTDCRL